MTTSTIPLKIRLNIDFISKEILTIESDKEIQSEILDICENISSILGHLGDADSKDLLAKTYTQL